MRRGAWIAGAVAVGLLVLVLQVLHARSNNTSSQPFKAEPMVELTGKGFGAGDMIYLATGDNRWPFSTPGFSERTLTFPNAVDLRPFSTLRIPLHLLGSSIGRIRAKLRFVHHNGWVYETWQELPLYFGESGTPCPWSSR